MKSHLFLSLFIFSCFTLCSQEIDYANYTWSKVPSISHLSDQEKNMPIVELLDKRIYSLIAKEKDYFEWHLFHSIIYLNSDAEIEKNNKIYIRESKNHEIIKHELRVINKDGTIVELDKNDIKESTDEETGQKYKYYAVRGLEKGSILETIKISKHEPKISGNTLFVQGNNFVKNLEIDIIHPEHLKYELKYYNGLKEATIDTTVKDKTDYSIRMTDIPALNEEEYCNYNANLKYLSFKAIANYASHNYNLNNYNQILEHYSGFFKKELSKKDEKALETILENSKLPSCQTLYDSILHIESYVKEIINYSEQYFDKEPTIANTFESKKANESDLIILYYHLFRKASIKNQFVITNNRYQIPFDKSFESYDQLDNYLFYFPSLKNYLSPTSIFNRIPYFNYRNGNNYGLFFKTVKIGDNELISKEIKFIDIPSRFEIDTQLFYVDFREQITLPKYKISSISIGVESQMNQGVFEYLEDAKRKEVAESILKNYCNQDNMDVSYDHVGIKNIGQYPVAFSAQFASNKLNEKNADKILYKIGEIIGKQMQLYSENKRTTPIDIRFPHVYIRKIVLEIPENYEFASLESLKINRTLDQKNEKAIFISDYQIENNKLTLDITEEYFNTNYSIENYEAFKAVINAAADFNKSTIIIQKKQ